MDAKADPANSTFIPYPAWYFLDLFGLLHLVPGDLEVVGAIVIPGIATLILLLLPWIDRSTTRMVGIAQADHVAGRLFACGHVGSDDLEPDRHHAQASRGAGERARSANAREEETNIDGGRQRSGSGREQYQASSGGGGAPNSPLAAAGQKVYSQNCSSCHGATGGGTPGAFPPLAGNPFVTGDAKAVITTVLNGKNGAITVNGANVQRTDAAVEGLACE